MRTRPLRRAIQRYVEDPMAEQILSNDLSEGDAIVMRYDEEESENELSFEIKKAEVALPEDDEATGDGAPPEASSDEAPEEPAEE